MREKYNLIQYLQKKNEELVGKKKLALVGQGNVPGGNNVGRGSMNNKHQVQHLAIDNPEFPMMYDGDENVKGENSSFYTKTDKDYEVIGICKKYEGLLKGKSYFALYFLHCKKDDSYIVVYRKEVENLSENFGFEYNNEYLDACEVGDTIPAGTVVCASRSYDEDMNTSIGVNGRILYAVHPAVQDDAIIVSESFAKRMVANNVITKTIPINENTILLNLYGKNGEYQGLPNIGDVVHNGILAATRTMKESRMFSDMRDISLCNPNYQSDQVFYCEGDSEVLDIDVYCNNPNLPTNKVTKQLVSYYNDSKWFYSEVYRICKKIIKSGSKNISKEIHRWMRKAMNYLDTQAEWAFNDNLFNNLMVEILVRKKVSIKTGRKITGRHGNKTVVCKIWPDEDMPYMTTETTTDEFGVIHPKGVRERVELITNPLAFINRTIPVAMHEGSVTFIIDRARKHAATLDTVQEKHDFLFDVMRILNPKRTKDLDKLWDGLNEKQRARFIEDCISLNRDGTLRTDNGIYIRREPFNDEWNMRDAIIAVYEKYGDIFKPYHIFVPKPKWGRDIYIGDDYVGYQYIMMLKQSGEKGFSVRSAGAISDESLPEKSHDNKIGKFWTSTKPIRFGEYETPNFMIITNPEDFALVTALYRSSIDGRRFLYEAILSQDGEYDIPDNFTSRAVEVLQTYMKSLGIRMETIYDEDEYIGEPEHQTEVVGFEVGNATIFCTIEEMYYLKKLLKVYKRYMKDHPNTIDDVDEVWDYIIEHLPFKKKFLTDNIVSLFKNNMEAFSVAAMK